MAGIWLVIKAVLTILPVIIEMVRDGKIKTAAYDEVLAALEGRLDERIKAAREAGAGELIDEDEDPYNRNRNR